MASGGSPSVLKPTGDASLVLPGSLGPTPRAAALSMLALVLLLAAFIYQPWRPIHLPIADWGELLRVLPSDRNAAESYHRLTATFRAHGRHQPVQMAAMAAQWAAFGTRTAAWRVTRFVVVSVIVMGSYLLARSLGVGRLESLVAASLFVIGSMAHQLWYVLQIGEPTGLLFLVAAALVAARYRRTTSPIRAGGAITALLTVSVLSKEPFLAAVPFVVLIAARPSRDESVVTAIRQRRVVLLVAAVGAALLAASIIPILELRGSAAEASYASRYGATHMTSGALANVAAAMLLPVTRVALFPANLAFLFIVSLGIVFVIRHRDRDAAWLLAAGLSAPVLGAVLYARWSAVEGYYGAAYLPGLALVFGVALSRARRQRQLVLRAAVYGAALVLLAFGALFAREHAREYAAARDVDYATAIYVAALPRVSSVIVAVPSPSARENFGKAFVDYLHGFRLRELPAAPDAACGEADEAWEREQRAAVVILSALCPVENAPVNSWRVSRSYSAVDWKRLALVERRVDAAVWTPQ